ncbi:MULTISPECIES: MarR family winged helix-turn-helix transcriptional regulator [Microbulbifer]|uniref:MarR family winged helix-turn-helix transcriptional regulator n=1 Tax=Microbulbifer TaxID=48073 RepID=UPI001E424909|nr:MULTISPECIES: MarR family transcriptional regulator [Microbulbifer]UHQ56053.1 MarR family transcriptional regulator [Microbulbifer sp. YPW16]
MDNLDRIQELWAAEMPGLDTSSMALIGRLQLVNKQMTQAMSATFRRHGLTDAGFDVLATLLRSGPPYTLTPSQLLDQMLVTSGSMTSRLDSLERGGFIERVVSPGDRRSRQVKLTTRGRAVIRKAIVDHVATQDRLLSVLTDTEKSGLIKLLRLYLARSAAGNE